MSNEMPGSKVDLAYSLPELERRTESLIAQDGPVKRRNHAAEALSIFVRKYAGSIDTPIAMRGTNGRFITPHHPKLDLKNTINLLTGNYGLYGEYGNGVGAPIVWYLNNNTFDEPFIQRVQSVVESLEKRSQLYGGPGIQQLVERNQPIPESYVCAHFLRKLGLSFDKAPPEAFVKSDPHPKPYETVRQSLDRCVDEIEKWVEHNKDVISSEDRTEIARQVAEHRQAYGEMLEWADYAKGYLTQIDAHAGRQAEAPKRGTPA